MIFLLRQQCQLRQANANYVNYANANYANASTTPTPTTPKPTILDNSCWDEHFTVLYNSTNGNNKINVIPSSVKEAPIDFVATVPKSFFIEESSFCRNRPNLKVLAYVHSAIKNTEERSITRSTWANASSEVGTLFFVGKSKDEKEMKIVERESKIYGDIVQGNYTDMYELLVYKALNALYWITKNCASIPWVVHADDDILLDVIYLLKVLDAFEQDGRTNEIFCHTFVRATARRYDKWKVNTKEYPCKFYPPYCSGPCWFTTSTVIKKLLHGVSMTKYLWVDDTYLTGLVAEVTKVKRSKVPMVNHYVKDYHLGNVIAWLNVKEDRTKAWQNILGYNNLNINNEIN
ncbi:Beta-1,3-galactosyltransferase bre-2, partial [Armadillidium vulgare]